MKNASPLRLWRSCPGYGSTSRPWVDRLDGGKIPGEGWPTTSLSVSCVSCSFLGGGNFTPKLGEDEPNLTNLIFFQRGWNSTTNQSFILGWLNSSSLKRRQAVWCFWWPFQPRKCFFCLGDGDAKGWICKITIDVWEVSFSFFPVWIVWKMIYMHTYIQIYIYIYSKKWFVVPSDLLLTGVGSAYLKETPPLPPIRHGNEGVIPMSRNWGSTCFQNNAGRNTLPPIIMFLREKWGNISNMIRYLATWSSHFPLNHESFGVNMSKHVFVVSFSSTLI